MTLFSIVSILLFTIASSNCHYAGLTIPLAGRRTPYAHSDCKRGSVGGSSCRGGNAHTGRDTVLDYVRSEAQAVVDDLNELDNKEYEL